MSMNGWKIAKAWAELQQARQSGNQYLFDSARAEFERHSYGQATNEEEPAAMNDEAQRGHALYEALLDAHASGDRVAIDKATDAHNEYVRKSAHIVEPRTPLPPEWAGDEQELTDEEIVRRPFRVREGLGGWEMEVSSSMRLRAQVVVREV